MSGEMKRVCEMHWKGLSVLWMAVALVACGGSGESDGREGEKAPRRQHVFSAISDGSQGVEPWVTNGTAAGTHKLREINEAGDSNPRIVVRLGNKWFFVATDGVHGYGLWVSDGSESGTRLIYDVNPDVSNENDIDDLTVFKGKLYFTATDTSRGNELWVSDGTREGTRVLLDIYPGFGSASPQQLTVAGNYLYFDAYTPAEGRELWVSDGTAEGTHVIDVIPGQQSGQPREMTPYRDGVVFAAYGEHDSANQEPYFASEETFHRISDINPGSASSLPRDFSLVGSKVVFTAQEGVNGREAWVWDGDSTSLLKDFNAGAGASNITQFVSFNSQLFFAVNGGDEEGYLWRTDGSTKGTVRVKGPEAFQWASVLAANDQFLFLNARTADQGRELWVSDGSEEGTRLLKDIFPGAQSSTPGDMIVLNNEILFVATNPENGRELWRTNGTATGTRLLKDLLPGSQSSFVRLNLRNTPLD